ncbi:hypothetical protein ILUMI_13071 [Ignelater luminosus]|uniref:HAT C-terminal dimerisation domain-containing protein n=1 Tax=Ignelater luminosus TaxID=2038154 RepID=A0A8K0CXE5_IGNLU|nr:hypothetical protein ILUMI_13071 [Ignelater luminosus]
MKQTQSCDQRDATIVLSDISSSSTPSDDSDELDAERIAREVNILQFWETMKPIHPELYELSKVVFGVPATQVSVERLFSGLNKNDRINSVPFEVISVSSSINEDELQEISHSSNSSAKQIMNKKRTGDINVQEGPHQIKKKQLRINNLFSVASQQSEK